MKAKVIALWQAPAKTQLDWHTHHRIYKTSSLFKKFISIKIEVKNGGVGESVLKFSISSVGHNCGTNKKYYKNYIT